jgi:hypothetical protein
MALRRPGAAMPLLFACTVNIAVVGCRLLGRQHEEQMHYVVIVQLHGELVCNNCFCASSIVVNGPTSVLKVNTDGEVTEAFEAGMKKGKLVPPREEDG